MSKRHAVVVDGHYINSLRAQYGEATQTKALRELVDNAVDANANLIEIQLDETVDRITIQDNGNGCDDLSLFFDIGSSQQCDGPSDRIGRYGIGGTWACLYLCDTEYVYTVSRADQKKRTASMRWTDIAERRADFKWEEKATRQALHGETHGTRIELHGIRKGNSVSRHIFREQHIARLRVLLGRTYGSAIATRGLVLAINDDAIDAEPPPPMVDGSTELELSGLWQGKAWHLRARHVRTDDEAKSWLPGVYVAYRGRLLNADAKPWKDGLGEHVGVPAWIWIELADSAAAAWQLNWDKSDFEDRDVMLTEVLASQEAVQAFLRDVDERARDIDSTLIGNDLSAMLNQIMPMSRVLEERPGNAGEVGTVIPIESHLKRRRATVVDPTMPGTIDEERKEPNRSRSWQVVLRDGGAEGPLCNVEVSRKARMTHGELVSEQIFVRVFVNSFLFGVKARLRDRADAMTLIAPSVAHKLAREHPDEFRRVYGEIVQTIGEQDEFFPNCMQAEKLAHVLMVRQANSERTARAPKKLKAR